MFLQIKGEKKKNPLKLFLPWQFVDSAWVMCAISAWASRLSYKNDLLDKYSSSWEQGEVEGVGVEGEPWNGFRNDWWAWLKILSDYYLMEGGREVEGGEVRKGKWRKAGLSALASWYFIFHR